MAGENNKIQELEYGILRLKLMQHLGNVTFRIGGKV